MTENGLPCLDLLEATPGILRALMTELTEADACWKPAPERFSVAEVLAHSLLLPSRPLWPPSGAPRAASMPPASSVT
jgi:hypothetical protein